MSSERRQDSPEATAELTEEPVQVETPNDKGNGASKVDNTVVAEASAITPESVERLLAEDVLDDEEIILEPPEGYEDVAEPILIEAIEEEPELEAAEAVADESPWIEMETIDVPERGAAVEAPEAVVEAAPEAVVEAHPEARPLAPPVEVPRRAAAPARQPVSMGWWMLGAVVLGAALGALAALLILGRINGGLAYTGMSRGQMLSDVQNRISTEIATLNDNMREVQTELGRLDQLSSELDILSSNLDSVQGDVSTVSDEIVSLTSGIDELSTGLGNLGANLDSVGANVDSLGGEVTTIKGDLSSLADDAAALQEASQALETSVGALDAGLTELGGQVDAVASEVETFRASKERFDGFLSGLRELLGEAQPSE